MKNNNLIQPENILIDHEGNIKLCDFGWSTNETDSGQIRFKL